MENWRERSAARSALQKHADDGIRSIGARVHQVHLHVEAPAVHAVFAHRVKVKLLQLIGNAGQRQDVSAFDLDFDCVAVIEDLPGGVAVFE